MNTKFSCSGRKVWQFHIRDWLDLHRNHAKIHGDVEFNYEDIDYAFGTVEATTRLWGGRVAEPSHATMEITKLDEYWLYDHGIGLKLPLTSKMFTEELYKESLDDLKLYHRKGNAIITYGDELARRIKEDFPDYQIEASCIQDINNIEKWNEKVSLGIYDEIVLPIHLNDDIEFLKSIKEKDKLRLFLNVECSYNCPQKVCYGITSKINVGEPRKMLCSFWDFGMPRAFYNDDIDWEKFYFPIEKFKKMGIYKYKLVPPFGTAQRSFIMYEKNKDKHGVE